MIVCGIVLINFASNVTQGAFRAGVAVLISYLFSFTLAVTVFFIRKNKLQKFTVCFCGLFFRMNKHIKQ